MLCEDVSGVDEAHALAQRLVRVVAAPLVVSDHEVRVNASIGLVVTDAPSIGAEDLIGRADSAMYAAKRKGRDRIEMVDQRTVEPVPVPSPAFRR